MIEKVKSALVGVHEETVFTVVTLGLFMWALLK